MQSILGPQKVKSIFASIVDSSEDAILSKDLDGTILSWNKGAEHLYGYKAEEMIGKSVSVLSTPENPDEIPLILQRLKRGERVEHYETTRVKRDGTQVTVSLTVSPIVDSDGTIIAASAIARDITDRKRYESERDQLMQELTQSLARKNVLLQEVYHRVKNNLQVVSSLLDLRSNYINDNPGQAAAAFKESIARIRAMALVHEKLYKTENLHRVDFLSYLHALTRQLVDSYGEHQKVEVRITGDPCYFNLDHAISMGLLFNELITNSLKYAFKSPDDGRIDIHFRMNLQEARIRFSDNGIGLPDARIFESPETFGLRIVKLLATQVKAEISQVESEKGTTFEIVIPVSQLKEDLLDL